MASAQYEPDEVPGFNDLRIVLLGVSGVGKSSTANAILGREVFKESRTRESEIQRGRVEDRNISIIDTPGFFNTQLTDEELKQQMMKSLFLSDPGPHVFLLIINLENFREEKRNIVEQIQKNFGEEAFLFTMVLFIGRERVSKREWTEIIESKEAQKILNYFEGRFHVINSKNECDSYQITKLLKSIDEMMKKNSGQNYSNEIYLKNQRKHREQKYRVKYEEKRQKQKEETMKQEQVWKRLEERDACKQREGGNQKDDIKTTKKEDVRKYHNERGEEDMKERTQYLRMKEDLRKQMESRKEKERQRWALKKRMTPEHSKTADLRIVILGKSDVGKTATANTILGRNAFRAGAVILTCEKQEAVVSGKTISITDTPRMLDGPWYNILQDELKRNIEECFEMSAPGPHVFLLVIRLNRRHTEEKNTIKWVQDNFGEEAVRHTIVLFTHVDLLMDESLDQYIRKSPDLQSLIDSCGGRFHSFNNQDRNNQNQVTELLEKIEQMIKDNKGEHYTNGTCLEAQNNLREPREKQEGMRHVFPFSSSPQEKQEQERGINQEDINTQSQEESSDGDNERNQEGTEVERGLHERHRHTDNLLGLMMGLELSEMALRLSLARAMLHSNLSRRGLRIVLLGLLGEGKSSTGNTILGRDAFRVSAIMTTRSCEKQVAVVSGKPISITDTPAIILHPFTQFSEIEQSLGLSAPGPHVFLLVIRVGGFTEERKNTVKWLQQNLEKDALNHTIIIFTHADFLNVLIDEVLNEYIQRNKDLKLLIDSCGGRFHTLNNKDRNNQGQVTELLEKIDEMLQRNGGRHYTKHNIFKSQDSCEIL